MKTDSYSQHSNCTADWFNSLPAHWQKKRIRNIIDIVKTIAGSTGHDVLSITQKGIKVKDLDSNEGQLSMDYSKYQVVEEGDFAMNHMDLLTGYIDIAIQPGVTSPDYRVFRAKKDAHLHPRFLLRVLQNAYTQKIFYAYGQGSSQLGRWRLPTDAFKDFEIPFPPAEEQKLISDFLDHETAKIDALISGQERLIELLQEKRKAFISHAVTKGLNPNAPTKDSGVEWLGEAPEHWKVKKLSWISNASKGKEAQTLTKEYCAINDGEYPVYSGQTNNEGVMGSLNRYEFDRPDGCLLITTVGSQKVMSIRRITGRFSLSQNCMIASPDATQVSSGYLYYALQPCFDFYRNLIPQHMQASFRMEDYYSIRILIPELDEQRQITSYLDENSREVNAQISVCEAAVTLLKERRSALISAAVTGQIDVRGLAPDEAAA